MILRMMDSIVMNSTISIGADRTFVCFLDNNHSDYSDAEEETCVSHRVNVFEKR